MMHRVAVPLLTTVLLAAPGVSAQRPAISRAVPMDLVCGPQATLTAPSRALRVVGGMERAKSLFAPGELVVVNGGTSQGLRAGQHFYVRRLIEDRFAVKTTEAAPLSVHTAGWVTIVEAKADISTAIIAEACDGVVDGDYLEPLALPGGSDGMHGTTPDFERPAHVILGDDRRQLGGEHSLMIIDRGSDHGLRPGQRLTVFRYATTKTGPIVTLGDAVVAATRSETSVMRILKSRESVQVGDLIAIHR